MSSRWTVSTTRAGAGAGAGAESVRAATLNIEDGCLIFRDEDRKITVAYSAISWNTVFEDDE